MTAGTNRLSGLMGRVPQMVSIGVLVLFCWIFNVDMFKSIVPRHRYLHKSCCSFSKGRRLG